MAYDLVIKGGTVVDGSGLPGYRADLGIQDGMIAKIGDLKGQAAKETIDAEGQIGLPTDGLLVSGRVGRMAPAVNQRPFTRRAPVVGHTPARHPNDARRWRAPPAAPDIHG